MNPDKNILQRLEDITLHLNSELAPLTFTPPVTHVYNPLEYAWTMHREYLRRISGGETSVLFLGMNPGPWGMAQTGIPFGSIPVLKRWLNLPEELTGSIRRPEHEHPKRPIEGFGCSRKEVSGDRLWGLMEERYPNADDFFQNHAVINYCPLVFMEDSGRNRTPDKLPVNESEPMLAACDQALLEIIKTLKPQYLIGVGKFAEKRLQAVYGVHEDITISSILHPSPASPAANRDWSGSVTAKLMEIGIWE